MKATKDTKHRTKYDAASPKKTGRNISAKMNSNTARLRERGSLKKERKSDMAAYERAKKKVSVKRTDQ